MKQVVVPSEHIKRVMSLAHESIVCGHLAQTYVEENVPGETQRLGQIFICSSVCIQRSVTSINRVLTIRTTLWENSSLSYAGSERNLD